MRPKFYTIVLVALFCCNSVGQYAMAQVPITMPFRYRNTENGPTFVGTRTFNGVGYRPNDVYCAADHRDPDGNEYTHGHLPHGFPFVNDLGHNVTVEKSDWAWDAYYTSIQRESGSTFRKNCFAYATDAPEVMFHDGWKAWTNPSTQCEVTEKKKSFGDVDHVIVITDIHNRPEEPCVISQTSEKNASGGVYTRGWLPLGWGTNQPVRKRK